MSRFPTVSIWEGKVTACEVGACVLPQLHRGAHKENFNGDPSARQLHHFVGRIDRDCAKCSCPTDHPVHLRVEVKADPIPYTKEWWQMKEHISHGVPDCIKCGLPDEHSIHRLAPLPPNSEETITIESTADLAAELERAERLICTGVTERPLTEPESLLHRAAVLAWLSQAKSLQEIAGATHRAEDHLRRIAVVLERWVP